MKRRAVQDSATRPHSNQMKGLNERNTNEDTIRMSTGEFFKPTAAATVMPTGMIQVWCRWMRQHRARHVLDRARGIAPGRALAGARGAVPDRVAVHSAAPDYIAVCRA